MLLSFLKKLDPLQLWMDLDREGLERGIFSRRPRNFSFSDLRRQVSPIRSSQRHIPRREIEGYQTWEGWRERRQKSSRWNLQKYRKDVGNHLLASSFRIQQKRYNFTFASLHNRLEISERERWRCFRIWLDLDLVNWLGFCFEFVLRNPVITVWNRSYSNCNRNINFSLDSNFAGFFVKIIEVYENGYTTLLVPEDLARFGFRFFLAHLNKSKQWFKHRENTTSTNTALEESLPSTAFEVLEGVVLNLKCPETQMEELLPQAIPEADLHKVEETSTIASGLLATNAMGPGGSCGLALVTLGLYHFRIKGNAQFFTACAKDISLGDLELLQVTRMVLLYTGTMISGLLFSSILCSSILCPGVNHYYTMCSTEYLALGGGSHFALYLDGNLLWGSSVASETYGNSCLSSTEDFVVKEVEVVNCHESVIYILAPLRYATVYGCSDATIVLRAVGKAVRVEHCELVHVIAAAKRICIVNCRECVFFLGVNQRGNCLVSPF